MASVMLGFPAWSDGTATTSATLTGGSWLAGLPLANLQNPLLGYVARSTNVTLASTKFNADLAAARIVRMVAIPKHTLSLDAKIRIIGSSAASGAGTVAHDSGWLDVWARINPMGSIPWGTAGLWSGQLDTEQAAGYNVGFVHVIPAGAIARHWYIQIDDTTNAAGYIDLARLIIADGYSPSLNVAWGARLGWETNTTRETSVGDVDYYDARANRRRATLAFNELPNDEALAGPFEIVRQLGRHKQLFFVFDPDDVEHMHRRSFLATIEEADALDFAVYGRANLPMTLREVL